MKETDARFSKNLESLLRSEIRQQLMASAIKQPILGGYGVAFGYDPVDPEEIVLNVESGLCSFAQTDSPPLMINCGDYILNYLGLNGTHPPATTSDQYLIGEARGAPCVKWSEFAPRLSNRAYQSTVMITEAKISEAFSYDPSLYSGLMRLAVQSKIGAGRRVKELSNYQIQPNEFGIFRSTNYIYWVVWISEAGCYAQRMITNEECLRQKLIDWKAGRLAMGEEDAKRMEVYLMSTLEVDILSAEVELLAASQLADIYTGRSPLGYGWKFSRKWENECSVVAIKEGPMSEPTAWYWMATHAVVSFGVGDDLISASIAYHAQDVHFGVGPIDKIWYPYGTASKLLLPPVGYVYAQVGDSVPIYCFYTDNGLCVVRYTMGKSQPSKTIDDIPICNRNCSGGANPDYEMRYLYAGWYDGGFDAMGQKFDKDTAPIERVNVEKTRVQHLGTIDCTVNLFSSTVFSLGNKCDTGEWLELDDNNQPAKFSICAGTLILESYYTENTNIERVMVINGGNPEAVTFFEGAETRKYGERVTTYSLDQSVGNNYQFYTMSITDKYGVEHTYSTPINYEITPFACDPIQINFRLDDGSTGVVSTRITPYTESIVDEPEELITDFNGVIIMSNKIIGLESSLYDWNLFRAGGPGYNQVQNQIPAKESFSGDAYYHINPAEKLLIAGYADGVEDGQIKRWIGWA